MSIRPLVVAAVLAIASVPAAATAFTVENASYVRTTPEATQALVQLVRAYGYRCDSVSAASPWVMSRGFTLKCNEFAYVYEIEDVGGTWRVTVD